EALVALGEQIRRRPVDRVAAFLPVEGEDGGGPAALVPDGHRHERNVPRTSAAPGGGSGAARHDEREGTSSTGSRMVGGLMVDLKVGESAGEADYQPTRPRIRAAFRASLRRSSAPWMSVPIVTTSGKNT